MDDLLTETCRLDQDNAAELNGRESEETGTLLIAKE